MPAGWHPWLKEGRAAWSSSKTRRHRRLSTSSRVLCVAGTSRELQSPPHHCHQGIHPSLCPSSRNQSPTSSSPNPQHTEWRPNTPEHQVLHRVGSCKRTWSTCAGSRRGKPGQGSPSASIQVRQTRLLPPQPCSRRIWGDSDPSFPRRHFLSPWGPSQFAHIMIPSFQQKPNTGDKRPVALPVYAHRFKIAQRSSRSGAREHAEQLTA